MFRFHTLLLSDFYLKDNILVRLSTHYSPLAHTDYEPGYKTCLFIGKTALVSPLASRWLRSMNMPMLCVRSWDNTPHCTGRFG
jgi:hypothetical protein